MQRHYVYRIKEITTGEFYWGVRTCKCNPKDDSYMGSMVSWKPNRLNLVKDTIIEYQTRDLANIAETTIIDFYSCKTKFPLNRNYHNGASFKCRLVPITEKQRESYRKAANNRTPEHQEKLNNAHKNRTYYPELSDEHKRKISIANTGKIVSAETRMKLSVVGKNRIHPPQTEETIRKRVNGRRNNGNPWHSAETLEKMSLSQIGKPRHSDERKKIISEQHKGKPKPRTPEHQAKLNAAQLGRKATDQTRENMRNAAKNRKKSDTVRVVSEETKDKIRQTLLKRNAEKKMEKLVASTPPI